MEEFKTVTASAIFVRYDDVTSADGTRIRVWTNDADGPTFLLSNGLGTNPYAWPSLLDQNCGVRIISWNHRGVSGSARPSSGRIGLNSYVEDAVAVLDHVGVPSAPVLAWSAGVTVAFELANRFPERVDGILAVAGVPGDTFGTVLAPFRLPPRAARAMTIALTSAGLVTGRTLGQVTRRLPWTNAMTDALRHSKLVGTSAETAALRALLQEFCTTDPRWYAKLAMAIGTEQRVSLSNVEVPVSFLAGRWDVLTGARYMRSAAERIPGSRYREINATHFIPVEHPDIVLEEIRHLITRL